MNKKSSYQAPSIHILKMDSEGVIAASTQDFGAGKRYDLGQPTAQSLTRGLFRFAKNLLPLVAAALMLPACGSEEEPQLTPEAGKTRITVTAGIDEVATRTTYTPGTNATADLMTVVWSSGTTETLNVVNYVDDVAQTPSTITGPGTGNKSMSFSGETTTSTGGALAGMYNYYYGPTGKFFPGLGTSPHIDFDLHNQEYDVEQSPIVSLKDYDVMYTTLATNQSNITLVHACALIRFNLRLNTGGKAITQITMSADDAAAFIQSWVTLEYNPDGTVTQEATPDSGTQTVLTLTIKNDVGTNEDRDLVAYMMLPVDDGGLDISGRLIKVSAIADNGTPTTDDDIVYSRILNLTAAPADTEVLEAGKCYTFFGSTTPLTADNFAGSNIYWDGYNLTFVKEPYDMSAVMNQGLYFKWGSLVGIAPNSTQNNYTTYTNGSSTNGFTTDLNSITSDNSTASGMTPNDICTSINPAYRMPNKTELQPLIDDLFGTFTKIGDWNTATGNATGTATIPSGALKGNLFLPAAGYIYYDGSMVRPGGNLYYWSGEAHYAGYAHVIYASGTLFYAGQYGSYYGMPIRCIKNNPPISE
ncbi:MAG: hypothetical protein LBM06_05830 [Prevotellaceae bacterium]|jgi:hypothetical protein|nr:hypothetical protein [Prevotellaceae bacterium]